MVNLFGQCHPDGPEARTLGGYMTWEVRLAVRPQHRASGSILALSGTLAGEASRGSLDFVAAARSAKRRIASRSWPPT